MEDKKEDEDENRQASKEASVAGSASQTPESSSKPAARVEKPPLPENTTIEKLHDYSPLGSRLHSPTLDSATTPSATHTPMGNVADKYKEKPKPAPREPEPKLLSGSYTLEKMHSAEGAKLHSPTMDSRRVPSATHTPMGNVADKYQDPRKANKKADEGADRTSSVEEAAGQQAELPTKPVTYVDKLREFIFPTKPVLSKDTTIEKLHDYSPLGSRLHSPTLDSTRSPSATHTPMGNVADKYKAKPKPAPRESEPKLLSGSYTVDKVHSGAGARLHSPTLDSRKAPSATHTPMGNVADKYQDSRTGKRADRDGSRADVSPPVVRTDVRQIPESVPAEKRPSPPKGATIEKLHDYSPIRSRLQSPPLERGGGPSATHTPTGNVADKYKAKPKPGPGPRESEPKLLSGSYTVDKVHSGAGARLHSPTLDSRKAPSATHTPMGNVADKYQDSRTDKYMAKPKPGLRDAEPKLLPGSFTLEKVHSSAGAKLHSPTLDAGKAPSATHTPMGNVATKFLGTLRSSMPAVLTVAQADSPKDPGRRTSDPQSSGAMAMSTQKVRGTPIVTTTVKGDIKTRLTTDLREIEPNTESPTIMRQQTERRHVFAMSISQKDSPVPHALTLPPPPPAEHKRAPSIDGARHRRPPAPETSLSRIFYMSGQLGPTRRKLTFKEKVKAAWVTKDIVDTLDDLELKLQIGLSELLMYILFVLLMLIITYGMMTPSMFYMNRSLQRQFISPFSNPASTYLLFDDIRTFSDVFSYLERTLVKGLYTETWYHKTDRRVEVDAEDRNVLFENKLLGLARLHMINVKGGESCSIHPQFKQEFLQCFSYYTFENENRGDFIGNEASVWMWKAGDPTAIAYQGEISKYSTSGYFHDLPGTKDAALKVIHNLKENTWLTRATRVLFVDFAVYNANVNLFCIVRLTFEVPPTGGVYASYHFNTVKLLRYVTEWDYFVLGCEFTYGFFILYYICEEAREAFYFGYLYFLNGWHMLDLVILLLSIFCFTFTMHRSIDIVDNIADLMRQDHTYINFQNLAYWQIFYNQAIAVSLFLCWCKMFKYLSFNRSMNQLSNTLKECTKEVANFVVLFLIIFMAFAQLGFFLFGREIYDYSTLTRSSFTLVRLILCDFNFEQLKHVDSILGPLFFICYMFFVFFILLNMLLAIMNEAYGRIRHYQDYNPKNLTIWKYLSRAVHRICPCCKPKKVMLTQVQTTEVATVSFNEIVKVLEGKHFTDIEIEMFLAKYSIDPTRNMTPAELQRIVADLERRGFEPSRKHFMDVDVEYVELKTPSMAEKQEGPAIYRLTVKDYETLQSRLDQIEIQLETMAERLEAILYIMQKGVKNKWVKRKN